MDEPELSSKQLSKDEEIRFQLEAEGWQLAGKEHQILTPLNSDTGRFEAKKVVSDEEIKERYLADYAPHGFSEIRLEPAYKKIAGQDVVDESLTFVYMRQPQDNSL